MNQRIYLVRHGEKEKTIGDPPLSEKGIRQAIAVGEYLRSFPIQKIVASPALRTQETAKYISDKLSLEFTSSDKLIERANWGIDPNQTFDDFLKMWQRASLERDWTPPIGDSSRLAGERLDEFFISLGPVNHVLLVTHGGVIADFLRNVFPDDLLNKMLNGDISSLANVFPECCLTTLDFDINTHEYKIIDLASTKHLDFPQ